MISGIGHNAALATVIAGIRADLGLDLRVSDNTIANIAPPTDFHNPAAGVLVVAPLGHVDVSANLIRRQLTPNDDNSPWEAVCILGFGSEPAGKFQGRELYQSEREWSGKCDQQPGSEWRRAGSRRCGQ